MLLFAFALVVRLFAYAGERWILGIGDDYHPDSVYYLLSSRELFSQDWDRIILTAANNEMFILWLAALRFLSESTVLPILANICFGSWLVIEIVKLLQGAGLGESACWKAGLYFSVLPYHVHLSVHLLKDIPFLLLAIMVYKRVVERRNAALTAMLASLMIFNRTYLGLFVVIAMLFVVTTHRLSIRATLIVILGCACVISLMVYRGIAERRGEIFEGRDLFQGVEVHRPAGPLGLIGYVVVAPFRNIIVPSVVDARSTNDVAFALHCLCYQALVGLWLLLGRHSQMKCLNGQQARILRLGICLYVALIIFADVATPGLGPLMRYREVAMAILAITLCATLTKGRHETDSNIGLAGNSREVWWV